LIYNKLLIGSATGFFTSILFFNTLYCLDICTIWRYQSNWAKSNKRNKSDSNKSIFRWDWSSHSNSKECNWSWRQHHW